MGCTGVQIHVEANATKSANEDDGVVGGAPVDGEAVGAAGAPVDGEAVGAAGALGDGEAVGAAGALGDEAVVGGRVRELEVIE